jgi:H+/gluconate symporter-like permease
MYSPRLFNPYDSPYKPGLGGFSLIGLIIGVALTVIMFCVAGYMLTQVSFSLQTAVNQTATDIQNNTNPYISVTFFLNPLMIIVCVIIVGAIAAFLFSQRRKGGGYL